MTEGLVCPLMTMGSDFLERCNGAQCAWWDDARRCCGVLPRDDDARYWLTPKGLAAIGKLDKTKAS